MKVASTLRTMSPSEFRGEMRNTLNPLTRLISIFSLDCTVPKTRWQFFWMVTKSLISVSVLGFLSFYTLYIKIRYLYDEINMSIKLTDAIQMCFDYVQYLIDLVFVFKYGRESVNSEYYSQYAKIDQSFSITNYLAIKERIIQCMGYFGVIWITVCVSDYSGWFISYGYFIPSVYATSYIYLLLKICNTLDLMSHVMQVEFRLKLIVDRLRDCYCTTEHVPGPQQFADAICKKTWFYSDSSSGLAQSETQLTANNQRAIRWLSSCYLILVEQCVYINKVYGIRILLNSLSLLIDMIRFTNIAVRLIIGSQPTIYASGYYPAAANLIRMVTCGLVVAILVSQCERAYRQQDTALTVIDHTLVNKDPDEGVRAALTDLRGLLQSRRVEFHTAYFFRLDYNFLVSVVNFNTKFTEVKDGQLIPQQFSM